MSRATQAGIVGADQRLHPVQHAFFNFFSMHEVARHLQHAAIHGQVVVSGSDDEVGPDHRAFVVDLVMMDQQARGELR